MPSNACLTPAPLRLLQARLLCPSLLWRVMTPRARGLSDPCACLGPCANVLATQAHPEEGALPQLDRGLQMVPGSAHPGTRPRFPLLLGWEKRYLVSLFWGSVLVRPHRLPPMRTVRHKTAYFHQMPFSPPPSSFPPPAVGPAFLQGQWTQDSDPLASWLVVRGHVMVFC